MNPLLKFFVNSPLWALLLERFYLPPLFAAIEGSPTRILEIGCGRGDTTSLLLERFPKATIVATDYDDEQIVLAARRIVSPRLTVRQADATRLPFADGAFDLVIECNSFHHIADWVRAIRECMRVLAPGGTFAVMDEDASLFSPLVRWFDKPESIFTTAEFLFAAESAGLQLIKNVGTKRIIRATFRKKN